MRSSWKRRLGPLWSLDDGAAITVFDQRYLLTDDKVPVCNTIPGVN